MKTLLFITFLLISSVHLFSQQASDYFPPEPVIEYTYEAIPLDSLNNQITSEMFYRRDLFVDVAEYEGKLANIFLTKDAPMDSIGVVPYLDSLFLHFDGTDGYEYFQTGALEGFLRSLDSLNLDPNFSFLDLFRSFRDWYSLYRFSATINNEYNLITVDTIITVLSLPLNVRFEYTGERFPDETITNSIGSFDSKKFLSSWNVSANFFGNWIDLLTTKDTIWIAPGNEFWMVQEHVPTNHVVLPPLFGIDPISIPGLFTRDVTIVSADDEQLIPTEIALKQNYPNPFNPSTSIQYTIILRQFVSLKVYDILGNEVASLVNSVKPSGVYEVEWNATGFTSGVYFYQLQTEGYVGTKKMILLK
jgi:hypothetical protein